MLHHPSIREEKQESRCPYCGKSYTQQKHFHTHVSNHSKQPVKQIKISMLLQDPNINVHDDDPFTADKEDQLLMLSMLQKYFQDEREFLPTMVAPEDLTIHKEDLVSSIFTFLTILID